MYIKGLCKTLKYTKCDVLIAIHHCAKFFYMAMKTAIKINIQEQYKFLELNFFLLLYTHNTFIHIAERERSCSIISYYLHHSIFDEKLLHAFWQISIF